MLLNLENVQFLQLLSAAVGQHFGDRAAVHLPAILTQPDSDSTSWYWLSEPVNTVISDDQGPLPRQANE